MKLGAGQKMADRVSNMHILLKVAVLTLPGLLHASCQMASTTAPEPRPSGIVGAPEDAPAGASYAMMLKPTLDETGVVDAIEVRSTLTGGLADGEARLKLMAPYV